MCRLSTLFSDWTVFSDRNDRLIGLPKVGVTCTLPILSRNRAPELTTGGFITITKRIANNLPGLSTQCQPNPDFIGLFCNERPEFIKFQGVSVWFSWIRIDQGHSVRSGLPQCRQVISMVTMVSNLSRD